MKEAVVIGAAAIDLIARVDKFPKPDEIVLVNSFEKQPGGSLANMAVALARLDVDVGFVGKIGNDDNGKIIIDSFKKEKVDTSRIIEEKGHSAMTFIAVDEEGQRIIFALGGKAILESPEEIPEEYIKDSKMLLVGETLPHVAKALANIIRDNELKLIYAPGGLMASGGYQNIKELTPVSEFLILSETELKSIVWNVESFDVAARFFLNKGAKGVIFTRGPRGALLYTHDTKYVIASYKTIPIDTTGAGDAFTAGFAFGFVRGYKIEEALGYATACAAMAITKVGARAGLPRLEELLEFVNKNGFPEIEKSPFE
ncbi:MAG: carbohydrate kinase family protein [Candidatus Asgardarchaeia archaeon]